MYYMYIQYLAKYINDVSINVHVCFCAKTGVSVHWVQTASFNFLYIFHNICVTFSVMGFSKVEQKKVQLSTNFLFYITYNTVYATLLHTTNVKTKWRDCSSGDLQRNTVRFISLLYIHTYLHTLHTYYITLDSGVSGSAERSRLPFNNHHLADAFYPEQFHLQGQSLLERSGVSCLIQGRRGDVR